MAEQPKRNYTLAERRGCARKRAQAESDARNATLWKEAQVRNHEEAKAVAVMRYTTNPTTENGRALATAARVLYEVQQLSGRVFAAAYTTALKADPEGIRKLIAWSRADHKYAEECTEMLVAVIAAAGGRDEG